MVGQVKILGCFTSREFLCYWSKTASIFYINNKPVNPSSLKSSITTYPEPKGYKEIDIIINQIKS